MRRRQVLRTSALFALGGLSSAVIASCTNNSGSDSTASSPSATPSAGGGKSPLKVGLVPWIGWGVIEIANQKGFFKEAGIEVEQTVFQTVTDVNTALLSRKIDLAGLVATDLLVLAGQIPDLKFFYASDYSGDVDAVVGVGINSAADLKGKKIAREDVPYEVVFTGKYLESLGLTEKDVEIVSLPVPDASAAFIAGKVDVAVLYEPFTGKALKERAEAKKLFTAASANIIVNGLAGSAQILQERRDDIVAYLKALEKASTFQKENPKEAHEILGKWTGVTGAEIAEQMKQVKLMDAAANKNVAFSETSPENTASSIDSAGSILVRNGKITKPIPGKDLVDNSFAQAML
jgi:NitT/TauT family transport system substrate-binding protein